MIQARAAQSQADAHRQALVSSAGSRRATRRHSTQSSELETTQCSASGLPVPGGRAVRHAVGTWLISFGTRLGGATVRTS